MLTEARAAQSGWAATPVEERLRLMRQLRHQMATEAPSLAEKLAEQKGCRVAEALSSEVIPTLDACRFLEGEAASILAPRQESNRHRPFWLGAVDLKVERVPHGVVLILGPRNYPFFLPAVQAVQALTAGNSVVVKPAPGGEAAMVWLAGQVARAGFPAGLLQVADAKPETGQNLIDEGVDLVVLTGSVESGRAVLKRAAQSVTPVVAELSGCDALLATPGCDLELVARALKFSLTLNHGQTCMATRRVLVAEGELEKLEQNLLEILPTEPTPTIEEPLRGWVDHSGGRRLRERGPVVLSRVAPEAQLLREAPFAPVVCLLPYSRLEKAVEAINACPYGLTAAVFGEVGDWIDRLQVGVILVNDLIAPTADPRLAFGGTRLSGFGLTRGREGLLQMTRQRSRLTRGSGPLYHLDPPAETDRDVLEGYLQAHHAAAWGERWRGLVRMILAVARERARKARRRRRERTSI